MHSRALFDRWQQLFSGRRPTQAVIAQSLPTQHIAVGQIIKAMNSLVPTGRNPLIVLKLCKTFAGI